MPLTKGFRTAGSRARHFQQHGADFASLSAVQYEVAADKFLGKAISQNTYPDAVSCIRLRDGDVVRYDLNTHEFGVLSHDGYIRTYYVPDVVVHGFATHYEYFFDEAQKR